MARLGRSIPHRPLITLAVLGAGANITVTPDTSALTLTSFAPTVTATGHVTATPTTAALTLTTFAPTVTASSGTTATPTTAALTLSTFAPTVSVVGSIFPSSWQRRAAITIDETLCGTADSTDFTVLIKRSATNFPAEMCSPSDSNRAQANGGDIRFSSDSAGATRLALDIENWAQDTTHGAADADIRLHVKVPTLSTSANTVIYVWYKTSTGTETQPAASTTYGSQNAYDTNHCHVYALDEAVSATPPEFQDRVGARHLTETGGTAISTTGKNGQAIDTNASGYLRGDYSGFLLADADTNAGLCYIPGDDRIAYAKFLVSPGVGQVVEVNKTTGAEISRFSVTQGEVEIQGLAYDSVADEFIVAPYASSTKYFYNRAGTFQRSLAITTSSQQIAYDFTDDALWVSTGNGIVRQVNKTTGATIATVTTSGGAASINIEGITHNVTNNTLYLTTDTGLMAYEINKSTGATIQSFRGPIDIEHPAYDHTSDVLWMNGDGYYHSSGTSGKNVIYKLTPDGQPFAWRAPVTEYTVEFWHKPDDASGTTILFSNWSRIGADGFYQEIQCRTGVLRIYDTSSTAFADSAAATLVNATWKFIAVKYTTSTDEVTAWVNNTLAATITTAASNYGPDGAFGIGGRPAGTLKHNGHFDDFRLHKVARSSDWLTARYNNQNSPSTFLSVGTPVAMGNRRRRLLLLG